MAEGGDYIPMERLDGGSGDWDWSVTDLPDVPLGGPTEDEDWIPRLKELVKADRRDAATKISAEQWLKAVRSAMGKTNVFSYREPPLGVDFGRFMVDDNGALFFGETERGRFRSSHEG